MVSEDSHDENVHIPVMADEVVALLGGSRDPKTLDGWIVDATLGAGGHSALLLERFPRVRVLGTDQDPSILVRARERLEPFQARVQLERCRHSELADRITETLGAPPVGFLADLGASSLQLDLAERGFSFQQDGPLDMRMDPDRKRTAAEIVNRWDEEDLADLFYHEGGEGRSRRIAAEIVRARRRAPFRRTGALADLVERTVGGGRGRIHPATRVFQALRRAVNEEGEELHAALQAAQDTLAEGGILAVIAFHSGEDGEVKRFLKEGAREGHWEVLTKKPLRPTRGEERSNPRARSARLRGARRLRGADPNSPVRTFAGGHRHEKGDEKGGAS
ncbi:MAG: 16S rRNA (cytosine(1402)-N(4))-methyltransferase RsmH [bacterium]|nr:16S rRNA (cytosine(1402)-N(4))-methyltransferase RsmH [bacterium]